MPRRRRAWVAAVGWTLWSLAGLLVAVLAGGYIYLDDTLEQAAPNTPEARAARAATRPVLPGEPVNVLLIGSDTRPQDGDPGRSDTLILVRMDSKRGFISMLSFPRDLYVQIPGVGRDKINAAYQYGAAKTIDTVQELTGEDVNEYVIVDFAGFQRLVDQVGGVFLDVDRRYFNKNVGTAATNFADIDLQPGYQRLNGADALAYVRYRRTDSDYARIARQQQFLSELKRQTNRLGNLTSVTSFRRIFADNVETSIDDVRRFLSLLELALTAPDERIARVSIQGTGDLVGEASVEIASPEEIALKVGEWRDPEFEQDEGERDKPVDPGAVDVTVLNGNGRMLAAERLAEQLRDLGYASRVGGNADVFDFVGSVVYYAPDFRQPARAIAARLGATATAAPLSEADARGNEVVVVVGTDYSGRLSPPPKPQPRAPAATVDTTSLVEVMRRVRQATGMRVMAPLKVAEGSRLRIVRPYRIEGARGKPWAVKLVFETGYQKYWGIMMTEMKDPPILRGETGTISSGGRDYLTYYDGRDLQRLAFQVDDMTFWISNTLANDLSANTIQEIAKSMRPLNRAKLPRGRADTPIEVETEGFTP